ASMIVYHDDLKIELDDTWWAEAGMERFKPYGPAYLVDPTAIGSILTLRVTDVAPMRRQLSHGVFNDGETQTARERVLAILRDFCARKPLYPVEVIPQAGALHPFRLHHGVHRFYCSLIAGFTHVPAIEAYDFSREGL